MSKTAFEEDMNDMVRESHAPESKKSLAMNFVRASGKLANGSRGNIEAVCDAFIAQTPILLEMYLGECVTRDTVAGIIQDHVAKCPLNSVALRKHDTGDIDWKRIAIAGLVNMGWPGAVLGVAIVAYLIVKLVLTGTP
jgi:hypothetical protein